MPAQLGDDQIALLMLSGTEVKVGVSHHKTGDSIWIQTDENPEPVYMRVAEAKLFIAALEAAVAESQSP